MGPVVAELGGWETFCVVVGAAAGALIGLQFVVMALIAERPPERAAEAGAAFATPTVVHFSAVLFGAALITVPWETITIVAALSCGTGLAGFVYAFVVARRMAKQGAYRPGFEDWVFHAALPMLAYSALAASSVVALFYTREALFGIAVAALLLLFVGIHNAWDAVAYVVFVHRAKTETVQDGSQGRSGVPSRRYSRGSSARKTS